MLSPITQKMQSSPTGILFGNKIRYLRLSFDDLRMQFDARIKDLILQGEMSLIVEIVKQLCDRD